MATLVDTRGKTVAVEAMVDDDWEKAAEEIDQSTVEQDGSLYPFCQYVYGKPTERRGGGIPYTGGWFIPADQVDAETLPGWEAGRLDHSDGSGTYVFFCRDIDVAVIHMRRRWVAGKKADSRVFPWGAYDQAAEYGRVTGRTHIMAYIKGLESLGPFVLTMSSSAGRAVVGSRKSEGALGKFKRFVVGPANALLKKKGIKAAWPLRAYWLRLGPNREIDGTPRFEKVGQGDDTVQISLPIAMGIYDKMGEAEIRALYVGKDLLMEMTQVYIDTDPWAKAWDDIVPGSPMETTPEKAAAPENGNGDSKEELPF